MAPSPSQPSPSTNRTKFIVVGVMLLAAVVFMVISATRVMKSA